VLDNLLRNAVHYTDRGGEIVLTLRGQGGQAAIAVRDTGIGIDAVHLDAVFDPYRQVDETRRSGGLGLGLTLVKRLVEMHGGSVSVYSGGKDAGTEFVVELPLAQAAPRPATAAQPRPSSHRVLVVDDEADIADAFAALLSGLGQETQVAYSGEKALEISRTQRPDIIFLDLAMPGMDGYELARHLREKHPTAPPALVALSGFGKEDHRADEVSHFDARLLKPAEMHDVVGILNGLPASRRS
jgi:CheY-like chemotaxis protein